MKTVMRKPRPVRKSKKSKGSAAATSRTQIAKSEVIIEETFHEDIDELAKGIFLGVEAAIDEARNLNCDVTEAELFLEKGYEQFKLGNFDYADNYCQLAMNSAKEASKKQQAEEAFHEIARMIEDNTEIYPNMEEIENKYRNAEKLFDQENYDEAIKILSDIKNDAIDIIFKNIVMESENKLQQLAEKIRKYRRKRLDVDDATKILAKANEAFDSGDYLQANEMADEALKLLNALVESELKDQAKDIIMKMNKLKTAGNVDKDSLEDCKLFFESMEEAYKAGHYDVIIEQEDELSEIAERIIKIGKLTEFQQLQERLNILEGRMSETENLGIDVTNIKDAINKSKKALGEKNYDKCRDWLQKAQENNDLIRNEYMEKKVQTIIYSAQSLINEISDIGAKIDDAESRLLNAKELLSKGKFDESRKLAEQTIIIARETLLKHLKTQSEEMIRKNEKILGKIINRGIDSTKVEDLLNAARSKFDKSDYAAAIELLKTFEDSASQLLNKDMSNQVMVSLKQFEEKIDQAREFDIPVDNFVHILENVKVLLEKENFQEADKVISKSLNELDDKIMDLSLRKKLNEVLGDIESTRNLGAGVKRLEAMRERALGALNKGDLRQAEDFVNKLYVATKKNLKETLALSVGKQLRSLENKLKALKERKLEAPEIDGLYSDAVEALRNRDYEVALKLVTKGDDLIDEFLEEDKAIKLKSELESLVVKIGEAKVDGLNVDKLEKIAENTSKKVEEGDFDQAKRQIRQIDKDITNLKETKRVQDLLKEIEAEMKEIKSMGVNIKKLENAFNQATKAMKRGELKHAIDIGRDINSVLAMIKKDRVRTEAREIFENVEASIQSAKEKRYDVIEAEELFTLARETLARNEFEECIKLSRRANELITNQEKSIMVNNVQRKLEVFQFEIDQAKNKGIEISTLEKSVQDVVTLLKEGKPNPAQDVLNLAQRNFKKVLRTSQEQKEKPSTMDISKDLEELSEIVEKGLEPDEGEGVTEPGKSEDKKHEGDIEEKIDLVSDKAALPPLVNGGESEDDSESEVEWMEDEEEQSAPSEPDKTDEPWVTENFKICQVELTKIKNRMESGLKIDSSQLESRLKAAEIAVGESNFKTGKRFLEESLEIIQTDLKPKRLMFEYKKLKADIDDLWSMGVKIDIAESALTKARKALNTKKLEEADKHLENLDGIVDKFRDEQLKVEVNEKIITGQKGLQDLSKLGVEDAKIKENWKLIKETKHALKENKVKEANDIITNVLNSKEQLENSYWESKLQTEVDAISELNETILSKDIKELKDEPKDLVEKSKRLQKSKSYKKALRILTEGRERLERQIQLTSDTKAKAKDTRKAPKVVSEEKSEMEIPEMEIEKVSKKDKKKVEVSKVPSAPPETPQSTAVNPKSGPNAVGLKNEEKDPESASRDLITDVVLLIQKVKSEDVDIQEPQQLLRNAKEEFICKNYEQANKLALQSRDILAKIKPELFKEQAEKDIEDLNRYFEDLKSIGVETEPLERNMKIIQDDYKNQDYVKVREATDKLSDKARRLKTEFLKVTLAPNIHDLVKSVSEKKNAGIDVVEIESYLADAEDSISDSDYDGACLLYKKAMDIFKDLPEGEVDQKTEITNNLEALKKDIKDSKVIKIDVKEIEKNVKKVEKLIDKEDYEKAEEDMTNIKEELTKRLKDHTDQLKIRVELEIEDVSLSGADTSSAMKLIEKSTQLSEKGEYFEAIKNLNSAERMAVDAGDTFVKLFEGLRRISREIAIVPKDASNYKELLELRNKMKKQLEDKDYNNAMGSLNNAMTLLRKSNK
ncbi:MAG: hypothetical protein JSV49_11510 [Thermoplasmata archaeon]|nr:MAG: hypothetical protein JSV49_11510 [Thermoplasmata archaeon]